MIFLISVSTSFGRERSSKTAGSAAVLRQIIPSRIWRTASYHWARRSPLTPFKGLRSRLSARSVLQNACSILRSPLATRTSALLLRASWQPKICESLPAARPAFSVGHFGQLIFTEWEWRVTDKTGVIKMITPVALPRMQSSYHFDNLILIRLQSSSQSGDLIRRELQIKLRKA